MSATELSVKDGIAVLALARPEAANAFNDAVLKEMVEHLRDLTPRRDVRAVVLRGKGKHFSAGADLAWMKASAALSYDDNIKDARGLIQLFEATATLPQPTLAVVTGSAFGGAVGLTACVDVAIAVDTARFCLSEVKLGLMPAVILPYLMRKMQPGQLRRHALSGRIFSAAEAHAYGLVQRVATAAELGDAVREELDGLLQGAPEAQQALKGLLARVSADSMKQGPHTAEAIAALRTGASGQAGLAAFFSKVAPPWSRPLAPSWSLDD